MTSLLKTLLEDADSRATTVGADGRTVRLLALQLLTWAYKSREGKLHADATPLDANLLKKGFSDCFFAAKTAINAIYPEAPPLPDCWNHFDFLSWLGRIERVVYERQLGAISADEIHELVTRPYEQVSSIKFIEPEVVQYMVHLLGDIEGKTIYCPFDLSGQFSSEVARVGGKAIWHSPTPYSAIESIRTLCNLDFLDYTGNPLSSSRNADTDNSTLERNGNNPKLPSSFDTTIAIYPGRKLLGGDEMNGLEASDAGPEGYFIDELAKRTSDRLIVLVSGAVLKHHNARKQAKLKEWYAEYGFKSVTELPSIRILGANTTHYVLDLSTRGPTKTIIFAKGNNPQYTKIDGRKKAIFHKWEKLVTHIEELRKQARDNPEQSFTGPSEGKNPPGAIVVPKERAVIDGEIKLNPNFFLVEKEDDQEGEAHYLLSDIANFIRPSPVHKFVVDESTLIDLGNNVYETSAETQGEAALELATSAFASYGYTQLEDGTHVDVKVSRGTPNTWIRENDLVMLCKGAEGSIGKVAIISQTLPDSMFHWCVSQMSIIIRVKPELRSKIDPRALCMFLRLPTTKLRILGLVSTDLVRNLRAEELGALKIPQFTPEVNNYLIDMFKQLDAKENELRKVKQEADEISGQVFKELAMKKSS